MPATELLIIATTLAILAAGATILIRNRNTRGRITPAPSRVQLTRDQLDTQLHTLIQQNKMIHAIKLLREQTGMGLREAKDAVDGLAAGRPISHPAYTALAGTPAQPDLATRARHLKEAGHTEQAILLVRAETGMNEEDAATFVGTL
ncbi:ribosomal protein L7/L12 [Nonomuraea sp. C10]|uniref:ribosomal protein L7/L12 n=1 Tax=Nonomuraea sp. C10 TaxID=2600577 RepID=UPI0011CE5B6D|nr:ribosomal protein L7/L12 [Nonomuraea sp. C10]TXK40764.1 50S ribosomal protein L7/L12 [Nonomuraea sp. C10]